MQVSVMRDILHALIPEFHHLLDNLKPLEHLLDRQLVILSDKIHSVWCISRRRAMLRALLLVIRTDFGIDARQSSLQ